MEYHQKKVVPLTNWSFETSTGCGLFWKVLRTSDRSAVLTTHHVTKVVISDVITKPTFETGGPAADVHRQLRSSAVVARLKRQEPRRMVSGTFQATVCWDLLILVNW